MMSASYVTLFFYLRIAFLLQMALCSESLDHPANSETVLSGRFLASGNSYKNLSFILEISKQCLLVMKPVDEV